MIRRSWRGDRIAILGPSRRVAVPLGATQADGRGKFLMPGLADIHAHLDWGYSTAEEPRKLLWLYLANGATTVRDMHSTRYTGAESTPLLLRRQVATGVLLGPRIYTAGDPDYDYSDSSAAPAAAARSVQALGPLSVDFVKIGMETTAGPVYDSIHAAAERLGLRLVGHVPAERGGVEQALRDRWASIEHLSGYLDYLLGTENLLVGFPNVREPRRYQEQMGRLDAAKLRRLAVATRQAGVWNCPTLALWTRMAGLFDTLAGVEGVSTARAEQLKLAVIPLVRRMAGLHLQITKALQEAGAGLLLGTDQPTVFAGVPPGFTIHDELAALVQAGLTPYQALATGTRNVAAFLGTLDSSGAVAVGKRADLVLVAGNPLTDVGYLAGPAGVMVGGRWLPRVELERTLDMLQQTLPPAVASEVKRARQQVWRH